MCPILLLLRRSSGFTRRTTTSSRQTTTLASRRCHCLVTTPDHEANSGNDTPGLGASNVFTASDEDARGQIFWSVRGEDADDFVLSSTGIVLTGYTGPDEPTALRFVTAPDYENPTDDPTWTQSTR